MARKTGLAKAGALLAIIATASCTQTTPQSAILDTGKVSSIVVGRSSRTDVYTALGRPTRAQQGLAGESWIYESTADDSGRQRLISGASAASGVAGAFVPYLGLVGSGLGLVNASADTGRKPETVSMTVDFGANGLVRDCTFSSTAVPAGMPGADAAAKPLGCQRPDPGKPSRS